MCLGGPECSQSPILDGKQVFRMSEELKIGDFRWKTAVLKKSTV